MSRSILSLALVAAFVLGGCPNNGSGSVPLDDLDTRLAQATCDYAARCQSSVLGRLLGTVGDCVNEYGAYVDEQFLAQIRAGIAAGTIAYHADLAGQCLDQFASVSCDASDIVAPSACNGVFEGLVPDGHACDIEQECGATSTCDTGTATTCPRGTCRHIAQLGEACDGTMAGMGCDSNLRCASHVCAPYARAGEACAGGGNDCGSGLTCSVTTGTGTCMTIAPAAEGASCTGNCASGLVCAGTDTGYTCSRPLTSGMCRPSLGSSSDCPSGQICTGATSMMMGTCGPPPGEGQPCSGVCATGLRCAASTMGMATCVRLHHVGETCATDSACYSGYCDGGTCASAPLCRTP